VPSGRRDRPGPSRYPRTARVNQVLREVLAEEIERLADADERLRLLTVTAVDTATDLCRATVYFASLPDDGLAALTDQRIHLQRVVARQMRLRRTPQLGFTADPAIQSGDKIEQILRQIRQAQPVPGTGSGNPATTSLGDEDGMGAERATGLGSRAGMGNAGCAETTLRVASTDGAVGADVEPGVGAQAGRIAEPGVGPKSGQRAGVDRGAGAESEGEVETRAEGDVETKAEVDGRP